MTPRRVLVTGASGFIGRRTLAPLREAGAEVHALTRHAPPPDALPAGVTWHRADLMDRAAVQALLTAVRPTDLLHLAWYVDPALYLTSLENMPWVGATLDLFDAFGRHGGTRVVAAGTSAEYDPSRGPCVERATPLAAATLYAACKRAVHEALAGWTRQTGTSAAWARVFFLHGPEEAPGRLVPQLVRAGLAGKPFALRYPDQTRDYMHVADTGAALAALLLSPVLGPVNIASGAGVTLAGLAREVGECLGAPVALGPRDPGPDPVPSLVADISRLRDEVGFAPHYTLREGLRDTVSWWKVHNDPVLT
jgi:nucleoside-diphosphate-sugar epimerase